MTARDIGVLRELVKRKKLAKELSLADKISKQHGQAVLQEVYKPVLESQETQKQELKKHGEKQDEQIVKQQQTIDEIKKSQSLVSEELRKQQLVIPLIKSLSKHKNIVTLLKGQSDVNQLTETERHILKELSHIDEKSLLTLVNYFTDSNTEKEKDDVFDTPISDPITQASELPEYSRIPPDIRTDIALGEWLFNDLMKRKGSSEQNRRNVETLLFDGLPADKKSSDDVKAALLAYVGNLKAINIRTPLGEYPWTTIRVVDNEFYEQVKKTRTPKKTRRMTQSFSTPKGTGSTAFLTSDPGELIKRLDILYAEKEAGNNNVLAEASAIADELRRQGVINTCTLKKLSKKFA